MCKTLVRKRRDFIKRIISITLLLILPILLMSCNKNTLEEKKEITVSVAASLLEPMNKIKELYESQNNIKININSGGSGTLKNQIGQGANVDVFFSANEKYINELKEKDIVREENIHPLLKNSLVLVMNKDLQDNIYNFSDLKSKDIKIALGEINTVPAGEYAKESLENMGLWKGLKDKIIYGKDVKVVKGYVENGNVDFGFIYKSDAIDLRNSKVVLEVPEDKHKEIIYSLAIIENSKNKEEGKKLVQYIQSDKGKKIFKEYGFAIN